MAQTNIQLLLANREFSPAMQLIHSTQVSPTGFRQSFHCLPLAVHCLFVAVAADTQHACVCARSARLPFLSARDNQKQQLLSRREPKRREELGTKGGCIRERGTKAPGNLLWNQTIDLDRIHTII